MKERCGREWSQRSFWCSLGEIWGWDRDPKQLNNQQGGQHCRLGNAHGARDDPEAASFRRAGNAPWAALAGCIMPPNLLRHTTSSHKWGPHEVVTSWGTEKQTEWLSFHARVEAKDTEFVLTQGRLPWLGLKAVKTPSTSCESCHALSALFPSPGRELQIRRKNHSDYTSDYKR